LIKTMNLQKVKRRSELQSKRREEHLFKQLLNHASQRLSFSEDVIKEMGTISFKTFDFSKLFHATGPLAPNTMCKKELRKQEARCKVNSLVQEQSGALEQASDMITKTSFITQGDNVFNKKKPFTNPQTKGACAELLETREKRKQQRNGQKKHIDMQNCMNKCKKTVNPIEVPQAPRLQDILTPQDVDHVLENILFTEQSRALKSARTWIKQMKMESLDTTEFNMEDSSMRKLPVAELSTLCYAIDKWRSACNISIPIQFVTIKYLKRALIDGNSQVRLEAIITCASGAVNGLREELGPGKADPSETGADSLVAAQCLAIEGDTSQSVIQRLLSHHFLQHAPSDQEQSMALLSKISSKTDLSNKLIHLMWTDWSRAVRHAAARALSNLDNGREMHNELSTKLEEGPSVSRLEALIFISQLKIMTPKLLPSFLRCFTDDSEAVRKQACQTAESLLLSDQLVLDQLANLLQNDPLWEVKVEAINALGKMGWKVPDLQELLICAVHHEEPRVQIAACEALSTSNIKNPQLEQFLQERYALESNKEVQRHIERLLKGHGYSLYGDQSQLNEIKLQV
ncbi:hypothetical protein DNTS_034417, partial [Danionella cerebrum]